MTVASCSQCCSPRPNGAQMSRVLQRIPPTREIGQGRLHLLDTRGGRRVKDALRFRSHEQPVASSLAETLTTGNRSRGALTHVPENHTGGASGRARSLCRHTSVRPVDARLRPGGDDRSGGIDNIVGCKECQVSYPPTTGIPCR